MGRAPFANSLFESDEDRYQVQRVMARNEWFQLSGLLDFSAGGSGTFDEPRYAVKGTVRDLFAGDEGIVTGRGAQIGKVAGKFIKAMAQHRHWDRESKGQMPA